jgi:hypothetical protein
MSQDRQNSKWMSKIEGDYIMHFVNTTDQSIDFIDKRHKFSIEYSIKQGWGDDISSLSIEQIMEIRKQPEWIEAGK